MKHPARQEVPTPLLTRAVDRAVSIPSTQIHRYVDSLRVKYPRATPEQLIGHLERTYLTLVSGSGGAVGTAAAWPGLGTGAAVALTGGQVAGFLAASAALTLAVADVHGIEVEDVERRRTLLLVTLLGEKGPQLLEQQLGVSSALWGRTLLSRMPIATVQTVNRALKGRVARGAVTKGGSIMLGRLLPFGVGAVVGFTGGRAIGRSLIKGLHGAFGPPPERFIRIIDAAQQELDIEENSGEPAFPGLPTTESTRDSD